MSNIKQITEILHTIFCHKDHETEMMLYEKSNKCCYYLEQSIEDTWNCRDHLNWIEQAEFFISLSTTGFDMLDQIVIIYRAADRLRKANPLYLKYVEALIKGD